MYNELTKIIVKVGKRSKIKLSHCKTYRAIIAEELESLTSMHNDCHIVIIESILESEEQTVKEFIKRFTDNGDNSILFYIPDENDTVTSGLADELDYNIYMTLKDLFKAIHQIDNRLNVSTLIDDKRTYNSIDNNEIPDGIVDIFGNLEDNTEITQDIEEVAVKLDQEDKEKEEQAKEQPEQQEKEQPQQPKTEQPKTKQPKESEIQKDLPEQSNLTEVDLSEIERLQMELRDTKYEYSLVVKDIQKANARVLELEELVNTLNDSKQELLDRYNEIFESDIVLEDPISLDSYAEIKDSLNTSVEQIAELKTSIETYKNSIEDCNKIIELKESNINDLQQQLDEINEKIESGEIHAEVIAEYDNKLEKAQEEKDDILKNQSLMQSELNELQDKLLKLQSRLDSEVEYKNSLYSNEKLTILKLISINNQLELLKEEKDKLSTELQDNIEQIDKLTSENDTYRTEIQKLKLEQSESEIKFEKQLSDAMDTTNKSNSGYEKKIKELQNNISSLENQIKINESRTKQEVTKLKQTLASTQSRLSTTESELQQKESDYNSLLMQSSADSSGVAALTSTNQALERLNKSLTEKLNKATKELSALKSDHIKVSSQLENYKQQCSQLNDTLSSLTSIGGTGVQTGATIRPIRYESTARIVTVMGSGSFGVTTTAMSIADRLSVTSSVLYVDFDMVSPQADTWFKKSPLCRNVPGANPTDIKSSGLGIFYELGIGIFSKYAGNIIIKCLQTKGGGIDYLSGCYYRVESSKVIIADYSNLLNILGQKYDYIIVDMGRLGSSELGDQIIKAFTEISSKNVVVTPQDQFNIRNFILKLNENSINTMNISWLLNMCNTTTLNNKIKESFSNARIQNVNLILTDPTMIGVRVNFLHNKVNRDKFELFINSLFST